MGSSTQEMNAVSILDVCRITPASNLPELSMPITYLDAMWLRVPNPQMLFFYQLADPTRTHFNSVIVPCLKQSLSLTLTHFSPLAGRLTWLPHDPTPSVLYKPNDSVSLTIAESNNPESFIHLTGNKPYRATESRYCVPELHATDTESAIISVQVTLFPNHGVAVGFSIHHAVLDGKSVSLFLKAWAHMNSADSSLVLPPELTPFLDRSVVQDPEGLCMKILERWDKLWPSASSRRSLKLLVRPEPDPTLVRATFGISLDDARKLRELALSKLGNAETLRLSTFVLAYSFTLACLVKAKKLEFKKVNCGIPVESRVNLNPQLPGNYLGNCIIGCLVDIPEETIRGHDGFVGVAKIISECIHEVRNKSVNEAFNDSLPPPSPPGTGEVHFGIAGSPRFEVYQIDFGWGRPVKMEYPSIDRGGGTSMAERSDGSGGLEIGMVMTTEEMQVFDSLFVGGLKHLS